MKKTVGGIVQEWRKAKAWSTRELAGKVSTSRQNIENLESGTVGNPRYLKGLAKVMGYARLDDLLDLKEPPPFNIDIQAQLDAGASKIDISEETVMGAIDLLGTLLSKRDDATREAAATIISTLIKEPLKRQEFKNVLQVMLHLHRDKSAETDTAASENEHRDNAADASDSERPSQSAVKPMQNTAPAPNTRRKERKSGAFNLGGAVPAKKTTKGRTGT